MNPLDFCRWARRWVRKKAPTGWGPSPLLDWLAAYHEWQIESMYRDVGGES
jgi:hypothetical protein